MKKGTYNDITGQRKGLLKAISYAGRRNNKTYWLFECDCGNIVERSVAGFLCGQIMSCNCRKLETLNLGPQTKHGLATHPVYNTWAAMVHRCYNPKFGSYHNYGARGIRVCEFLRASPRNVVDLIGHRPPGLTIDRINNESHYTCGQCAECLRCGYPLNVRWADQTTQNNNSRNCHFVTLYGRTQTIAQWAREFGVTWNKCAQWVKLGTGPFTVIGRKEDSCHSCL